MSEAFEQFQEKVSAAIFKNLKGILGGDDGDLRSYAQVIARDMAVVIRDDNEDARRELIAQLKGVSGVAGIRANAAGWKTLFAVVGFALDMAVDGAFGLIEPAPDEEDQDPAPAPTPNF